MGGIKEDWEILVFLSRWGTQAFTKGDILCEKQSKTQKNSFHVWFHTVPLLSSLPPDWAQPHWGPQTSSGHCCLTAVTMGLHLWDVAVLKAHDLKWRTLQEIKKNSAERFLSSESLLKIYHFPWRKSHVHGEFISTNGHGRIFPRKLLVHILAAWECSPPLPVANVAPSATKPVVPACPPSFQSAAEAWCVVLQWSPSILAQVKPIHCAPGAKHVGEPLCQDCGPPSWGTMEHTAHHIPSPCLGSAQLIFLFCSFFLFTIHCKNKKKGTRFLKLERYIQWKKTNSILKWLSQWWLVICAVSSTW